MPKLWNYIYAALAAAALATAYWFIPLVMQPDLEFRPRTSPPGMRDLVLDQGISQGVSAFNAVLNVPEPAGAALPSRPTPEQMCRALFHDKRSPASGAADLPVQIITFLDYRCPYCRTLSDILAAMPDDNARIVYREWPILGPPSVLAARAALAANRQGRYAAFHNRLMRTRLIPTPALIDSIATDLGLDVEKLQADMNAEATVQEIGETAGLAAALGFSGTPSLVVGRTVVQGEITRRQLEKLIAEERRLPPPKNC